MNIEQGNRISNKEQGMLNIERLSLQHSLFLVQHSKFISPKHYIAGFNRVGGLIAAGPYSKLNVVLMARVAFKMQLHKGFEEEYLRRHDALWPDLEQLLKATGISDYSIFLDASTNALFGVLKAADPAALDNLPQHPVMQKWWAYMKDIMESNPDNSPVSIPLKEVFYLP